MKPLRIFISSVQKEFSAERIALRDWLRNVALMHRIFQPFLFEDEYGNEDAEGVSPTERELILATTRNKTCLIFVKGADDQQRHAKMRTLIGRVGNELIRRRYASTSVTSFLDLVAQK